MIQFIHFSMQARRMLRRRDVLLRRGTGSVTSAGGRGPASRRPRGQRWLAERRRGPTAVAAGEGGPGDVSQDEEGDVPEDEFLLEQIRGNSLNPNTPLGRAVADACEELEDLAKIEREVQDEAFALLEKLGMKRGPVEGEAAEGEAEDS